MDRVTHEVAAIALLMLGEGVDGDTVCRSIVEACEYDDAEILDLLREWRSGGPVARAGVEYELGQVLDGLAREV